MAAIAGSMPDSSSSDVDVLGSGLISGGGVPSVAVGLVGGLGGRKEGRDEKKGGGKSGRGCRDV